MSSTLTIALPQFTSRQARTPFLVFFPFLPNLTTWLMLLIGIHPSENPKMAAGEDVIME
jgi:hypothetical protein